MKALDLRIPGAILCAAHIWLAASASLPAFAQKAKPAPQFNVQVNIVALDVEVLDAQGRPILDLKQEDFAVKENGASAEVAYLNRLSDTPLSMAIVLETSFMPQARMSIAKDAVFQLIHILKREDEICLYTFDQRDAWLEQAFTRERALLVDALDNVGVPARARKRNRLRGLFGTPTRTGLGVDLGLAAAAKAHNDRKAILLIAGRFEELGAGVFEHVQAAVSSFLMLGFADGPGDRLQLGGARRVAGELIVGSDLRQPPGAFFNVTDLCRSITYLLKNHYSLGFHTRLQEPPEGRNIEVLVPGRQCRIYARRSYIPARSR